MFKSNYFAVSCIKIIYPVSVQILKLNEEEENGE